MIRIEEASPRKTKWTDLDLGSVVRTTYGSSDNVYCLVATYNGERKLVVLHGLRRGAVWTPSHDHLVTVVDATLKIGS